MIPTDWEKKKIASRNCLLSTPDSVREEKRAQATLFAKAHNLKMPMCYRWTRNGLARRKKIPGGARV